MAKQRKEITTSKGEKISPIYSPTKWERRFDNALGLLSPGLALARDKARQHRHYFRYMAAMSTPERGNANPNSISSETNQGNRERRQLMWNALAEVENSGLASSIQDRIADYVCGRLRYQARTGDARVNTVYEQYLKYRLGRSCDWSHRHTLRQICMLSIKGVISQGDSGLNVVAADDTIYLQGVEGKRIGNPYEYRASKFYIGGVHLTDRGGYDAFDIYTQDRMSGQYLFENRCNAFSPMGLPTFLFNTNPNNFDDIRGRSAFRTILDNVHYLRQVRNYELQAAMWASSQSGVYYTKSGELPDKPFEEAGTDIDQYGNTLSRFSVRPNTITALGVGEDVKMFQNERPSPNVMMLYRETIREIATAFRLSFGFCYDLSGVMGTAVRQASSQDKRTIQSWQAMLEEQTLDPAKTLFLGDGIANGDIPYCSNWNDGKWSFPPHPTVDAGRESNANVNEYLNCLTSGSDIAEESGKDIDEVQTQVGHEVTNLIKLAMQVAKDCGLDDWREIYPMLRTGKNIVMAPQFEAARAAQLDSQAEASEAGATSDGEPME